MKKTVLAVVMLLSVISGALASNPLPRYAIVKVSAAFLRAEPDYESPLETQALMGTVVEISRSDRYWREIACNYPRKVWVNDLALAPVTQEQLDAYREAPKVIVTFPGVEYVLESPAPGAGRVCDVVAGDVLQDTGVKGGGYWKVRLPDGVEGWLPLSAVSSYSVWAETVKASEQSLVEAAMQYRGVPYMWGGISAKGFDCSGLTGTAYLMNGILLPRNASQQVHCGMNIPLTYRKDRSIDISVLRPGDLLFFGRRQTADHPGSISHVALYIGGGRIIHASQLVRVNSIVPGAPDYYEREVLFARRILGHEDDGAPVLKVSQDVLPGTLVK